MQWSTCLWPGLAPLWLRGQWSALALAAGFSLLLNAALSISLVWTELVSPTARAAIWLAVAVIWTTSLVVSARWLAKERRRAQLDRAQDLLPRIQGEYLQGHWIEAEAGLLELLTDRPRDAEARLLLASLYRHTDRLDEAARELGHLERLDTALQWQWEIGRERQRVLETPRGKQSSDPAESELPDEQPEQPEVATVGSAIDSNAGLTSAAHLGSAPSAADILEAA